jgi:hypothetical protein
MLEFFYPQNLMIQINGLTEQTVELHFNLYEKTTNSFVFAPLFSTIDFSIAERSSTPKK